MKKYIGTKIVKAELMSRQAYNDYRGWEVPADEDGADAGFLVEEQNGMPNAPDRDGYVTWHTLAVFNNTYKELKGLSYGAALDILEAGGWVKRKRWNGKGAYIYKVECSNARNHPYLNMRMADGSIMVGWTPNQVDQFAKDWEIYPCLYPCKAD